MTVRELMNDAAPWLCLTWGVGIIITTAVNAYFLRRDPMLKMTVEMMPWILVITAVVCVAWPALVIKAVILGIDRDE